MSLNIVVLLLYLLCLHQLSIIHNSSFSQQVFFCEYHSRSLKVLCGANVFVCICDKRIESFAHIQCLTLNLFLRFCICADCCCIFHVHIFGFVLFCHIQLRSFVLLYSLPPIYLPMIRNIHKHSFIIPTYQKYIKQQHCHTNEKNHLP